LRASLGAAAALIVLNSKRKLRQKKILLDNALSAKRAPVSGCFGLPAQASELPRAMSSSSLAAWRFHLPLSKHNSRRFMAE
jgi:hypothetical protein